MSQIPSNDSFSNPVYSQIWLNFLAILRRLEDSSLFTLILIVYPLEVLGLEVLVPYEENLFLDFPPWLGVGSCFLFHMPCGVQISPVKWKHSGWTWILAAPLYLIVWVQTSAHSVLKPLSQLVSACTKF